jgi:hypothetical protein
MAKPAVVNPGSTDTPLNWLAAPVTIVGLGGIAWAVASKSLLPLLIAVPALGAIGLTVWFSNTFHPFEGMR